MRVDLSELNSLATKARRMWRCVGRVAANAQQMHWLTLMSLTASASADAVLRNKLFYHGIFLVCYTD